MDTTTTNHISPSEVDILARILGKENGQLPTAMARYLLTRGFSESNKARMHSLAVRNQDDALSPCREGRTPGLCQGGHLAFDPEIQGPSRPSR
jgi:hypothetical protein